MMTVLLIIVFIIALPIVLQTLAFIAQVFLYTIYFCIQFAAWIVAFGIAWYAISSILKFFN